MTTQAQIIYQLAINAATHSFEATIEAQMAAVPLPLDYLFDLGVGFIDDIISIVVINGVDFVQRQVDLSLVPTVLPTFHVARDLSADTGPITLLTINNAGQGLVAPPLVVFGDSFVIPSGIDAGQAYVPPRTAIAKTSLDMRAVPTITNGGAGYNSATTTVVAVGGLMPGGVPASIGVTVAFGVITAINLRAPGGPYVKPPTLVAVDDSGSGSGAVFGVPDMKLHDVTLVDPGLGYVTPTAVALPLFKKTWPDGGSADQRQPFFNLLTNALQSATSSPIITFTPTVS